MEWNLMRSVEHDDSLHVEACVLGMIGERMRDLHCQVDRIVSVVLDVDDLKAVGAVILEEFRRVQVKASETFRNYLDLSVLSVE